MFDLLIRNGTVVDGTGGPSIRADLGLTGGRIDAIGDLRPAKARREIDASGLVVTPGFVDTHTHTEGVLLDDPQHANGLRQGITTEIVALDGVSYAPLSGRTTGCTAAISRACWATRRRTSTRRPSPRSAPPSTGGSPSTSPTSCRTARCGSRRSGSMTSR